MRVKQRLAKNQGADFLVDLTYIQQKSQRSILAVGELLVTFDEVPHLMALPSIWSVKAFLNKRNGSGSLPLHVAGGESLPV